MKSEKNELPQVTLQTVFLAMMYTAKSEGVEVDAKYLALEDYINENNDLSLSDMIDNIQNVYKFIADKPGKDDDE